MKINLRLITYVCLLFAMTGRLIGTVQIPDILIYQGERLSLRVNPLASFYSKANPRPKNYFYNPSISSACWRGYVATWEIVDDHLYLTEIRECHGKRTAPLEKFFPKLYKNRRVAATWYTGLLKCPRGGLVKYEHMSYRSERERELQIEIYKGAVSFIKEYGNLPPKPPSGYTVTNLLIVKVFLPESLFPCSTNQHTNEKSKIDPNRICLVNSDNTMSLAGKWERKSERVFHLQPLYVKELLRSQSLKFRRVYASEGSHSARGRWGYYAWWDGYDTKHQAYLRIFVMANRSNTITLRFTTTQVGFEPSKEIADIIFKHVKLKTY